MSMSEFRYTDIKVVHKEPYAYFVDAGTYEFVDSQLYAALKQTEFKKIDPLTGAPESTLFCDVANHSGPVFLNLKGDYDYLWRWYHNDHRKANTRHGSYIMLYLTDSGYVWKLSDAFFTKILSIPDNITDLFDFG